MLPLPFLSVGFALTALLCARRYQHHYNESNVMMDIRVAANKRLRSPDEFNLTSGYARFGRAPYNSP